MKKQDYNYFTKLIEKEAGWSFSAKHYYMLEKKVANFAREKNYARVDDLIADIKKGNKLVLEQLIEALPYTNTYFFRDHSVFSKFSSLVLPKIKEEYRTVKKLYVWSCGCSMGQEPYSIAILLKEAGFFDDWQVSVMGTDFCAKTLAHASKGVYNNFDVQMGNNIKTILKYFNQKDYGWQIKQEIASNVEFRKYNLLANPLFTNKFDIIFCRNTIKYFSQKVQKEMIERLHSTQSEGGLLYLGMNEILNGIETYYEKVVGFDCLYQAKSKKDVAAYSAVKKQSPGEMPVFEKPDSLSKIPF